MAGPASALTPPPPPSGIAFSFGGKILRIGSDGSDRRELTKTGPFANGDSQGRVGDAAPQLSPDGSHLLVTRTTPRKDYGVNRSIVLAGADGTEPAPILRGTKKVSFSSPAWMPDGQSVAVAREVDRRRGYARSVVIAGLDGKSLKTVFKLPLHRTGENFKLDEATYREPIDIGVSPDGSKLLVTVSNGYFYDKKYLVLVDLETGKQRTVGKNTRSGSFSPGGERFVYVSSAGNKGETCTETDETSCVIQGDLYTQDTDGGDKQRVTRSRAAEENPDWSPDGLRIAFDANYNLPKSGAAAEIYAIAPDGSCLSWLTNGSPASVEPDWSPDAGRSDLACGIDPREPVLAGDWTSLGAKDAAKSVWGGPVSGDRLVSQAILTGPFRFAMYDDCAVFDAKACAPAPKYDIGGISTCFAGLYLGLVVGEAKRSAFGHRKGVAFLRESGGRSKVKRITVFTGDTMVSISGDRRTTFAQLEAQIDTLRPADTAGPPKKLPALYLPKGMPNVVDLVARLVRRTGIKRAAERLDAKPNEIRPLLTFSRRMEMLGPIKTEACSKEEADPFGDI
ncbi:MAG: PD40 domain-containing protein [Thermoleophilia bacterium]|nr:PD40 domain-containing protein [Thermoleophilia bacterium]